MIGKTLGHYQITSQLGKGGMGEVYQAKDQKLGRDVAIKILPEEFAKDADRVARFQREAKVLASLNHPNIAAIYGLEESDKTNYLVMELVEGQTLANRIKAGPIPVEESLKLALQVAEALEAAHEKGVIHRDLKPANIKVTPEGKVKVLDFGLAKAFSGEREEMNLSNSPTLSDAATQQGVILGTAAYMAPEQARGSVVDKRCDIWSFGVVLFEMLTGRQLFACETVSDTLAAVLRSDVDWNILPASTPGIIRNLLRRCLIKDRKQRLQAIGDARIVIEEFLANPASESIPAISVTAIRVKRFERFAWEASVVLLAAVLAVLAVIHFREAPVEQREIRFQVITPSTSEPASLAISPDGRSLVFVASSEGQSGLWLRPLDQIAAQPLARTEGARYPFWSPNSRSIAFFANGKLKRIDIAGGPPQELASAYDGSGGTWNRDGVIVFAPSYNDPLYRISASEGGVPVAVTQLDVARQRTHRFPQFLPDGRRFLFFVGGVDRGIYIGSLDSAEIRRLVEADSAAIYASPGYMLFMRQNFLYAQNLDAKQGKLTGDPVRIADSVASVATYKVGGFSASETGILAYRSSTANRLAWFNRDGKEVGNLGAPDENSPLNPELSPDGRRLVLDRTVQGNRDVWLIDVAKGSLNRFTYDGAIDFFPIWSSDGNRIVFSSYRKNAFDLYQQDSGAAGKEAPLLESRLNKYPNDWSPDGHFLLYEQQLDTKTGSDLYVLPLFGEKKPFPFADTSFDEALGQFSLPDGRWVAFVSNETGRYEVYLQPFPGPGGKILVSTDGGYAPRWRHDGKELFYIAPNGELMAVPIQSAGKVPEIRKPVSLFPTRMVGGWQSSQKEQYAVAFDDQRFLINTIASESISSPITIITNWTRALKK